MKLNETKYICCEYAGSLSFSFPKQRKFILICWQRFNCMLLTSMRSFHTRWKSAKNCVGSVIFHFRLVICFFTCWNMNCSKLLRQRTHLHVPRIHTHHLFCIFAKHCRPPVPIHHLALYSCSCWGLPNNISSALWSFASGKLCHNECTFPSPWPCCHAPAWHLWPVLPLSASQKCTQDLYTSNPVLVVECLSLSCSSSHPSSPPHVVPCHC